MKITHDTIKVFTFTLITFVIIIVGITSNFIVVMNNNGKMPVLSYVQFETDKHFSFRDKDSVNHYYLTDIIEVGDNMVSIGDVLMLFGTIWLTCLSYGVIRRYLE